jgi:hypothetical protein
VPSNRKVWCMVVHGENPWPTVVSKHFTERKARDELESIRFERRFAGKRLRIVRRPVYGNPYPPKGKK